MAKFWLVFLACAATLFAGGSVTGGVSNAIGSGSDNLNLGFNGEGAVYGYLTPGFAMGGEVGFQRWSVDLPTFVDPSLDASISYFTFLLIGHMPLQMSDGVFLFLQPGLGVFPGTASVSYNGTTVSSTKTDFGISIEGGFDFSAIEFKSGFKSVFTEGESTRWFNFGVGFHF